VRLAYGLSRGLRRRHVWHRTTAARSTLASLSALINDMPNMIVGDEIQVNGMRAHAPARARPLWWCSQAHVIEALDSATRATEEVRSFHPTVRYQPGRYCPVRTSCAGALGQFATRC
jgi:hypothetical protein